MPKPRLKFIESQKRWYKRYLQWLLYLVDREAVYEVL